MPALVLSCANCDPTGDGFPCRCGPPRNPQDGRFIASARGRAKQGELFTFDELARGMARGIREAFAEFDGDEEIEIEDD